MEQTVKYDWLKSDSLEVAQIAPCDLAYAWDWVQPMLMQAKEYWKDFYTLPSLYTQLLTGKLQLWALSEVGQEQEPAMLLLLTEIVDYPACSELRIVWLSGRGFRKALRIIHCVDTVARRVGCSRISFVTRDSLGKLVERHGYARKAVLYERVVTDGD